MFQADHLPVLLLDYGHYYLFIFRKMHIKVLDLLVAHEKESLLNHGIKDDIVDRCILRITRSFSICHLQLSFLSYLAQKTCIPNKIK